MKIVGGYPYIYVDGIYDIRCRTRVVGSFPDDNSALVLVCARLRHVAGTQWGNKKYMNMKYLKATIEDLSIIGWLSFGSRSAN